MPEQQREIAITTSCANGFGPIAASKGSPPPLSPKPVPKPRRRLTIGGADSGGLVVQSVEEKAKSPLATIVNGKTTLKPVKGNAPTQLGVNRKAVAYRNGTAPTAPQMPRRVLKCGPMPARKVEIIKTCTASPEKVPSLMSQSTIVLSSAQKEQIVKNSKLAIKAGTVAQQSAGRRLRVPAPPPLNQQQLATKQTGRSGMQQCGKAQQVQQASKQKQLQEALAKELSPVCPTASPEATITASTITIRSDNSNTGSSLNSPSPPPPPVFARSWPSGAEEQRPRGGRDDRLLEELANEGGVECRLIASWLANSAEGHESVADACSEEVRPRFSLDRLVPPELHEPSTSSMSDMPEQSVLANFNLRRPSPRGQCQGTVFVHYHQAKSVLGIGMDSSNGCAKQQTFDDANLKQTPPPKSKSGFASSIAVKSLSPSPRRAGVTPLEQLVKSHPIWFLPHLDRQAVSHLLRNQPPGVFIVRGCSRINNPEVNDVINHSNSTSTLRRPPGTSIMALSMRLASNDSQDEESADQFDHFLLEAFGHCVRLEGSPHAFASLPLLLEHYSQPEALQELKCRLRLPEAVLRSDSIQALQGLALMGQDFWTSSLANANLPTNHLLNSAGTSPASSSSTNSSRSHCQSPTASSLRSGPLPPMPLPPPPQAPNMSSFVPQMPRKFQQRYCQSPCLSNASTPGTTVIGGGSEDFSIYGHQQQFMATQRVGCCCCAGCPAHQQQQFAPLRKSQSVQSSLRPATSNNNGRMPWCPSPGSQSLREGRKQSANKREGGFLRGLFSPSPSRKQLPPGSPDCWRRRGTVDSPLWEEELTPEAEIWNNSQKRAPNRMKNAQSNGQSIFARLKGNFRRTSSSGLSKDDWQSGASSSNMSPELLWARQAAFKRNNTDMAGNAMAAALGRIRQQQQCALPPSSPLPQLARVLPQPRRDARNGNFACPSSAPTTALPLLGQIPSAPAPADIRKSGAQKQQPHSRWARPIGQHFSPAAAQLTTNKRAAVQPVVQRADYFVNRASASAAARLSNNGSCRNSQAVIATVRPQPKMAQPIAVDDAQKIDNACHSSEYTQLNELKLPHEADWDGRRSFGSKNGDELSVAGTDFNEPWDSNAWENLLDLARFGDAKADVPLLTEQMRRRSNRSSSSNGSTWRRSRSSSTEGEERVQMNSKKEVNEISDEASLAEEARAMAMVLSGNGTLPNRKKPRTTEWRGDGEENDPPKELDLSGQQNASMDTLILIEQAAKAASSSRGNGLPRSRWTRETSHSLMDISMKPYGYGVGVQESSNVSDRPELLHNGTAIESGNDKQAISMSGGLNQISNGSSAIFNGRSFIDEVSIHRRSERRIKAMFEKSIEEKAREEFEAEQNGNQAELPLSPSPTKKIGEEKRDEHQSTSSNKANGHHNLLNMNNIAQFNSAHHLLHNNHHVHYNHHHHHGPPGAVYSSSDELSHHSRSGSICPSITPVLSPSRLREHPGEEDPARIIQRHVENLSTNDQTVFGATLQRFIECTLLSREQDPYVVIRRVRQFLTGMKNYLINNGEGDLNQVIERESTRLHVNEFLNIDAILEGVLNKILLVRIKAQLYRLMILETTKNGELGKLSENLATVRSMSTLDLGFPEGTPMPDTTRMDQISKQLRKMHNHYSPLKKFQLLLRALALAVPHLPLLSNSELRHQQAQQSNSSVLVQPSSSYSYHNTSNQSRMRTTSDSSSSGGGTAVAAALKHPPADELIRWLVYLLARSSQINCEIEAWYMWELLPQQVLSTGDATYFLSILFSAVHVLKHPDSIRRLKNVSLPANHQLPNIADFLGSQSTLHDQQEDSNSDLLLRIAIPNEQEGTIEYHTFPVLPKMNAAKLCRVIAHQFSVSNPEDYGLFVIIEGAQETLLTPSEFPHLIRDQFGHQPHMFAYKRFGAHIAWSKKALPYNYATNPIFPYVAAVGGGHDGK